MKVQQYHRQTTVTLQLEDSERELLILQASGASDMSCSALVAHGQTNGGRSGVLIGCENRGNKITVRLDQLRALVTATTNLYPVHDIAGQVLASELNDQFTEQANKLERENTTTAA